LSLERSPIFYSGWHFGVLDPCKVHHWSYRVGPCKVVLRMLGF
jgi:hypothetical protein